MLTTLDPTLHVCRCRTCLEKRNGQTGHELIDDDLYHDEDYVYPEYQPPKHPATTLANLDDFVWPLMVCTGHYKASHGFPRQHHQPHGHNPQFQILTLALASERQKNFADQVRTYHRNISSNCSVSPRRVSGKRAPYSSDRQLGLNVKMTHGLELDSRSDGRTLLYSTSHPESLPGMTY